MENKSGTKFVGLGFLDALTILFIALKLCGVISWSWVWVLSPLWITAVLIIVIFMIAVILVWFIK